MISAVREPLTSARRWRTVQGIGTGAAIGGVAVTGWAAGVGAGALAGASAAEPPGASVIVQSCADAERPRHGPNVPRSMG